MLISIILIVALLGFIGAGWKDGFIHTLGGLIGAVIGFAIARSLSISIAFIFAIFLPSDWARFVAFLLIFGIVTWIVGFVFKLAEGAFKIISFIPFLKSINNLLGAILGIFEGIIFMGGCIWIIENFSIIPWLATMLSQSSVAHIISQLFEPLVSLLF